MPSEIVWKQRFLRERVAREKKKLMEEMRAALGIYERVFDLQTGEWVIHRVPKERLPECGAKCRNGQPCRAKVVRGFARCRMHGGASTGPKTAAGKARVGAAVAESNRRRVVAKRAEASPSKD